MIISPTISAFGRNERKKVNMNEAHFSALLSAHFMAPRPEEAILFILLRNVDHPEESDKNDLHEVTHRP